MLEGIHEQTTKQVLNYVRSMVSRMCGFVKVRQVIGKDFLRDALDLHVHVGPDFFRRRYSALSLAAELRSEGLNMGAVLKNHTFITTSFVSMARENYPEARLFGSVVLNHFVGGVSVQAIRGAMAGNKTVQADGPLERKFIVWMPTNHAEAHLNKMEYDFLPQYGVNVKYSMRKAQLRGITVLDATGRLKDNVQEVLKAIAEHDLVLATGHLSADETKKLVRSAFGVGVRRIILTHPFYDATNLSIQEQVDLAKMGAFVEHTYAVHTLDNVPIKKYVESIKAVGPERTVLSTDLGQASSPPLSDGMLQYLNLLTEEGISKDDLSLMIRDNPAKLMES